MVGDPEYKDIKNLESQEEDHDYIGINESDSEDIDSEEEAQKQQQLEESIERIEDEINNDFKSKVDNITKNVI